MDCFVTKYAFDCVIDGYDRHVTFKCHMLCDLLSTVTSVLSCLYGDVWTGCNFSLAEN